MQQQDNTYTEKIPRVHQPIAMVVAEWPIAWSQMVFERGLLPSSSENFTGFKEETTYQIVKFNNLGCVFVDAPRLGIDYHPCVKYCFLPPAYPHIITWHAFGERIPKIYYPTRNMFECSHLCEAFW